MPDQLKVDAEPKYVQIVSEPYIVLNRWGYAPVLDVIERKTKATWTLFISAATLSHQLELLKEENGGNFSGLEFWIRRESYDKRAPYILEQD